jgi:hypothetical protein
VELAVRSCCENSYHAFSRPAGTSLVCIQGDWSNVVDARIKGLLAAAVMGERPDSPYSPLYARAGHLPRPWGVTALLSEYTGLHQPLDIEWSVAVDGERPLPHLEAREPAIAVSSIPALNELPRPVESNDSESAPQPAFSGFWEFAVAMNRSDPAALALAGDGESCSFTIEPADVRKLLGTVWFRSVVPRLSEAWRARVLDALANGVTVPNHRVRRGKQAVQLSDMSDGDLQELAKTSTLATIRPELDLLLAVGRFWGDEGLRRLRFTDPMPNGMAFTFATLFHGLRHGDTDRRDADSPL